MEHMMFGNKQSRNQKLNNSCDPFGMISFAHWYVKTLVVSRSLQWLTYLLNTARKEIEKITLVSDHNGSPLRQQTGATTMTCSAKGKEKS